MLKWTTSITLRNNKYAIYTRVDMVETIHDDLLTQWRHIPMGQFCPNIFLIWTTYVHTSNYLWASESFQKSEFLKLIISFLQYFWCQIEISGTKWVEKTPIYIFSTFGSKINEFGRKKLEKKRKSFKNLKVAGNYPSI